MSRTIEQFVADQKSRERMLLCVRACAGIPDDALGKEPVRVVREALTQAHACLTGLPDPEHVAYATDKVRAALALLGKE